MTDFLLSLLVLPVIGGIIFISASFGYGVGHEEGKSKGFMEGWKASQKENAPPF